MKKILTLAVIMSVFYSVSSYAMDSDPENAFAQLYFDKSVLANGLDLTATFVATLQSDDKSGGDKYIFTTTAYVKETDNERINIKHVCKSSNIECNINKDCPKLLGFNATYIVIGFLREKQNILPCADGEVALDLTNMSMVPTVAFVK